MKQTFRTSFLALTVGLALSTAHAAPKVLITHNTTDFESNAYIGGNIPSQHPTRAHTDGRVFWATVKLACFGHIVNGQCPALIKMKTDTDSPIDLGFVELDLASGVITPSVLHGNGYTMIVNGLGESTLIKD